MSIRAIVIIDDDKTITTVLRNYLEYIEPNSGLQMQIHIAHDGVEGLGLVYVLDPSLTIIDTTLPRYSGREVWEMLHSNERFDKSKIVILTQSQVLTIPGTHELWKGSPDFLEVLVDKIFPAEVLQTVKSTFRFRLVSRLLHLANKADLALYSSTGKNFLYRAWCYLSWLSYQLPQALLYTVFRLTVPAAAVDEIKVKEKNLKYRVWYYPTLVTLISALLILLLQVGLFIAGGVTILSTVRLESVFALSQDSIEREFTSTTATDYDYDPELLTFTDTGVSLKGVPVSTDNDDEVLPTDAPAPEPTTEVTAEPSVEPTADVTSQPTEVPPTSTPVPTALPTTEPTSEPTVAPSAPEVLGANIEATVTYPVTADAVLTSKESISYSELGAILEISNLNDEQSSLSPPGDTINDTEITYQLSPDADNWYYWDTEWTRTEQNRTSSSDIQTVNANLAEYATTFNTGELFLKIFLYTTNTSTTPVLEKLIIQKESVLIQTVDDELPADPIAEEQIISALDFTLLEVEIFNASYVSGQKVVLGKVLNIDKSVKTKYEITDEELSLHTVKVYYANGNSKGSEIGTTTLYKNSRGEIEFLLRTPSNSGGYVTAEVMLNDEPISPIARPVENSTFTVDSSGDEADLSAGDGLCITSAGTCTLRAAIGEANALGGADNIYFNIPTSDTGYRDYDLPDTASSGDSSGGDDYWTIRPSMALPNIIDSIDLDGATQTVGQFDANILGPEIEVQGLPSNQTLNLQGGAINSQINGLILNNVSGSTSHAAINSIVTNLVITNNYLGTDIKGLSSANPSTTAVGVLIRDNVATFVGTDTANGNVIAGFREGVRITCTNTMSEKNFVRGNNIGLGSDGTTLIGNSTNGIFAGPDCKLEIGGDTSAQRNYISGSGTNGFNYSIGTNTTAEIHVFNNFFGTDVTGTLNKGNVNTDIRIQGGGTATANIQRIGAAGKGNLMRFTTRSIWLNSASPMNVVIEGNTISDQIGGSRGILLDQVDNNTIIQNNALGAFESDPYFGKTTGPITGEGIQMRDGGSPIIRGNIIQSASTHGVGSYVGNLSTRSTSSANRSSNPVIGGQNPLAGSLCNGLEQNCIRGNAYSGIYSIDTVPANEATLWADNDFTGGNGEDTTEDGEGDRNIEQVWNGIWEIHTSNTRRTDLSGTVVDFPDDTYVTTAANLPIRATSATAINVTCLGTSGVSCPASGHTNGTLDNTYMLVPSGQTATALNDADFWFRVTEYTYNSEGIKTDYSAFKFDQPHFASGTFTFDADSTDNVLATGSARTIDGQDYTDRGEPWTDKPLATRNIATGDLGRFQIMEIEFVDANPVEQEDGSYVITVDSTEDTALATGTAYYNDGAGTASGGMTHLSTSVLANGKTSLREAIAVSNNRTGFDNIHFLIPETDDGFISPDGSRASTAEGAGTYPSTPQGYFTITHTGIASITDSLHLNGQSMPGTSLNSAGIGDTLNANLRIQIIFPSTNLGPHFYSSDNIISGLNLRGITSINGSTFVRFITSDNNWIYGNYFGSDIDGTINSGYRWGRMSFESGSADNIVGTDGDGVNDLQEKNLLTGYATHAMVWMGTAGPGGKENSNNVIAGNYIRTDKTGRYCNPAIYTGTDRSAVAMFASANGTRIGTNEDGISDSEESNILACVFSDQSYTQNGTIRMDSLNNSVVGNYINTNPHGDNLNPNPITNGNSGIKFQGYGNLVKNNIVKFSSSHGIYGRVSVFYDNEIIGNIVEQNQEYGIYLDNTNTNQLKNFISLNRVTNNGLDGIRITQSDNNQLSQNSVFDNNGKLDINLATGSDSGLGVTPNDPGDVDSGPNNLMNYPVVTGIEYIGGGQYQITGTLDNTVSGEGPFEIEVCLSSSHASGHGGCTESLGILENVSQNMSAPTSWSTVVTVDGDNGTQERSFTTLATNALGSTSEFSSNVDEYTIKNYAITLNYPISGITIDEATPTLSWTPSLDPDIKEYQVYLDGVLLTTVDKTLNQYKLTSAVNEAHTWQVKGIRTNDTASGESGVETFTVALSTGLELVYPINGSKVATRTPVLDWNATDADESTHYEIYLDGKLLTTQATSAATSYTITVPLTSGNHTWYVVSFYRSESINIQTGRSSTESFVVELVYAIDLQVTESVITGGKYTRLTLGWSVSGSSLSDAQYYLFEVFDPDGNLIFSRQLPLDSLTYELTAEELALLDPDVNYTFSLVLVDGDENKLGTDTTDSKLITLPDTGSEEEVPTAEVDTDDDVIPTLERTFIWVCCSLLVLTLLALLIYLWMRQKKNKKISKS